MSEVDASIDNVLIHYGKKGMKWGKRTSKVKSKVGKKKGPSSEDAARASELYKKAKTQGVQSLSNKEIQDLVTRINLTSNYAQAAQKRKSKGRQFAEKQMMEIGNDLRREVIKATVTGPVKAKMNATLGPKNKNLPMSAMWGD